MALGASFVPCYEGVGDAVERVLTVSSLRRNVPALFCKDCLRKEHWHLKLPTDETTAVGLPGFVEPDDQVGG
jgi:hypothetical protein